MTDAPPPQAKDDRSMAHVGAGFAALPAGVRNRQWLGPLYGVGVWLGFEALQAPLLGLEQAKRLRPLERLALIVDHLLYGFVLSDTRRTPRE